MSNNYLPSEDPALLAWIENFVTVAIANGPALNLDPGDIQTLTDFDTTFTNAMSEVTATKRAAQGAVSGKNAAKADISSGIREYARRFKSIPGVSPNLLSQLGIISNQSSGPVVTVTGLTVVGCSDGVNKLTWNRAGNGKNVQFIIEYRASATTPWLLASVTSKVSFDHEDQTPGQQLFYRVTTARAGSFSAPCPPVVVYPIGGFGELKVAA